MAEKVTMPKNIISNDVENDEMSHEKKTMLLAVELAALNVQWKLS